MLAAPKPHRVSVQLETIDKFEDAWLVKARLKF